MCNWQYESIELRNCLFSDLSESSDGQVTTVFASGLIHYSLISSQVQRMI